MSEVLEVSGVLEVSEVSENVVQKLYVKPATQNPLPVHYASQ